MVTQTAATAETAHHQRRDRRHIPPRVSCTRQAIVTRPPRAAPSRACSQLCNASLETTPQENTNHERFTVAAQPQHVHTEKAPVAQMPSVLAGRSAVKVSEAGEGRLSDADFWRETPDEYAATTWFQNLYWPDGVRCPTCVGCDVQTIDDGGLQSHRCNRCQRDFSLTTETLMEGLAIPLLEWRQALLIMTGGSTLGSVPELSRRIGWDVATAREATRRLLLATIEPVRPLREPAELDWTWVDHPRAEGYRGKSLAIAVIGRASHRVAGLRTIPREREREVHRFVGEHLAPGMTLFVDTHASNRDIPDAIKYFVDHHRKQYACGPASTNLPEGLWQRIKRTLHTDYDWYFNDNLDLWLAGLQWRENQRDLKPRERMMALAMAMRWKAPTQVRDRTDRHEQLELGSTFDHRCDDCENADCLADRHQRWGRGLPRADASRTRRTA